MDKVAPKLELFANFLIIIAAFALISLLAFSFYQNKFGVASDARPAMVVPDIGSTVKVPDFPATSSQTLLLVMQVGCKYCSESILSTDD